jgi:hypothetical protein
MIIASNFMKKLPSNPQDGDFFHERIMNPTGAKRYLKLKECWRLLQYSTHNQRWKVISIIYLLVNKGKLERELL